MSNSKYYIYLNLCTITIEEYRYIKNKGINIEDIYHNNWKYDSLKLIIPKIAHNKISNLVSQEIKTKTLYYEEFLKRNEIKTVVISEIFKNGITNNLPVCVFVKGDINIIKKRLLLVILEQSISKYGLKAAKKLGIDTKHQYSFIDIELNGQPLLIFNNIYEMALSKEKATKVFMNLNTEIEERSSKAKLEFITLLVSGAVIIEAEYNKEIVEIVDSIIDNGNEVFCIPR